MDGERPRRRFKAARDEVRASETGASETGASETGAPETGAPETGAPETGAPEPAGRDAREPLETTDLAARLRRLSDWELVREGRILQRRYRLADLRAALAFAAFVGEAAEGDKVEPALVVGLSSVQVRLKAPAGRDIGVAELDFADAIDFVRR